MKSLQHLCLERLPKSTWDNLSPHLQALLITPKMRYAFTRLQKTILHRRRRRMENIVDLLTTLFNISLVPGKARQLDVRDFDELVPGDHLVVMVGGEGGYGHHGLYLGVHNGQSEVAHFASPTEDPRMEDATIHVTRYGNFTRGYHRVYVVPYEEDSTETRESAMKVARELVGAPRQSHREYNLHHWNCENFVLFCKTGQYQNSEQITKFMKAIKEDIRSQESIIGKSVMVAVRSSGGSKCIIM